MVGVDGTMRCRTRDEIAVAGIHLPMGASGISGPRVRAQKPRSAVVLIDDRALRAAVVALLQDLGWRVSVAESYRDARANIDNDRPGVLLVEPGLHLDLLEKFVAGLDDRTSVPGVVILSDLQPAATIAREHQVVFVREPFDLEDLENALERARYSDAQPRSSREGGQSR